MSWNFPCWMRMLLVRIFKLVKSWKKRKEKGKFKASHRKECLGEKKPISYFFEKEFPNNAFFFIIIIREREQMELYTSHLFLPSFFLTSKRIMKVHRGFYSPTYIENPMYAHFILFFLKKQNISKLICKTQKPTYRKNNNM